MANALPTSTFPNTFFLKFILSSASISIIFSFTSDILYLLRFLAILFNLSTLSKFKVLESILSTFEYLFPSKESIEVIIVFKVAKLLAFIP